MGAAGRWRYGLCCGAALACGTPLQAAELAHWAPPNRFNLPVLGWELSARTRLVYQPFERQPWGEHPGLAPRAPEQAVGLEFRPARPGAAGLRHVLRVQLSSTESLQFRPRGGGLTVTYRAQF